LTHHTPPTAITAALIIERCSVTPRRAGALAEFAALRADGINRYDAAQQVGGYNNATAERWDRWLTSMRRELGMPPLPSPIRPRPDIIPV
jgi:hypothetical protein